MTVSPLQVLVKCTGALRNINPFRRRSLEHPVILLQIAHGVVDRGVRGKQARRDINHDRHADVFQFRQVRTRRFSSRDLIESEWLIDGLGGVTE